MREAIPGRITKGNGQDMAAKKDNRPYFILRKTRGNRYTLPVLLGCIEAEGLSKEFRILIADTLEEIPPKVGAARGLIGFSFMTPHLWQVKEEVEWLRKNLGPGTIFLAGGSHATGDPEGTLSLGFDFVFAGEAERTLPAFLRRYLNGQLTDEAILRGEQNSPLFTFYPPHSLEQGFFSPMEITRGCFYHCAFCQAPRIFGHSPHHRSPATVAKHLAQTITYGYRESAFISSNAFSYGATVSRTINLASIEEFLMACREAGLGGILFGCYPSEVRPDWICPEGLQLVKKYCRNQTIVLGAQSGSDALLARLDRGHTAQQALQAARWISLAGFRPHVDFVFGFPEETMEDRQLSRQLMETMIREYGAKIHAHTYMPLPGTPLFPENPSTLDDETKNILKQWEGRKKLDGWWREQEIVARKIVAWRDQGVIQSNRPG